MRFCSALGNGYIASRVTRKFVIFALDSNNFSTQFAIYSPSYPGQKTAKWPYDLRDTATYSTSNTPNWRLHSTIEWTLVYRLRGIRCERAGWTCSLVWFNPTFKWTYALRCYSLVSGGNSFIFLLLRIVFLFLACTLKISTRNGTPPNLAKFFFSLPVLCYLSAKRNKSAAANHKWATRLRVLKNLSLVCTEKRFVIL